MKKLLSAMLALIMAVSLCGGFTALAADEAATAPTESPAGSGLYPDASYTVQSTDLDANDNWLYRELVPDVGCEGESSFISVGTNRLTTNTIETNAQRVETYKHSGNYSWYRNAITDRGIGFKLTENLPENDGTYISTAYVRSDMTGASSDSDASNVHVDMFANYSTATDAAEQHISTPSSTKTTLTKEWTKYTATFTLPTNYSTTSTLNSGAYITFGITNADGTNATAPNVTYTKSCTEKTQPVYSIYVDDWSIRRALPDDFANAYTKSISPKYMGNGDKVTFTFSLDIDPRTVRKENIKVNNAANSDLVSAVNVTTDDTTRETTLEITLQNMTEGEKYTVSLPELTDAWGRDVTGASETAVTCVTLAEGETVNEEEFDENGNWLYRELVPDVGCETTGGFVNYGAKDAASTYQTDFYLSNDAHSGEHGLERIARTNTGFGIKVPKLASTDIYIMSAWLKGECKPATGSSDTVITKISAASAQGQMKRISDNKVAIFNNTGEWTYYSEKVKVPGEAPTTEEAIGFALSMSTGYNETIGTNTRYVQKINVDDWSIRRALPDSFRETVMKSAVYDKASAKATFTFNLDIDPRTVRKENIKVDNAANSDLVSAVNVTTNDITRATTLTVQLAESAKGAEHTVSLPELEDAWGREVGSVVSTGLSASEIKVTDQSGNAVEADATLTEGETYTVTITGIYNGTTADADMAAIIALFDGDDKLLDMHLDQKIVTAGTNGGTLSAQVTVPNDKTDCKLKTFVWDLGTLTPYTGLTD